MLGTTNNYTTIHNYFYCRCDSQCIERYDRILEAIAHLKEKIMHTLDEVLAEVTSQTTDLDSLKSLVLGLKQQVADLTNGVLPPAVQAKVDAIFDAAVADRQKIADALAAGTP